MTSYLDLTPLQRRFITRLCIHTLYHTGHNPDGSHLMTMIRMLRTGKLQIEMVTDEETGVAASWIRPAPEWAAVVEEMMSSDRVIN